MKAQKILLLLVLLLVVGSTLSTRSLIAQDELELLQQMAIDEQNTIDALVVYPESIRTAMLEASVHPELIIRVGSMQKQSSSAFNRLMDNYSQDEQKQFWELVRYPELMEKLVEGGKKSKSELQNLVIDYDEAIQPVAYTYGLNSYDDLAKIHQLHKHYQKSFESILIPYREETKAAMYQLMVVPEVLSMLTENIALVVMVGDIYLERPEWLKQQIEERNLEVVRANAKAKEVWAKNLEDNPQVMDELQDAAETFADENGYDRQVCSSEIACEEVEISYHFYPYPYWYGYPSWHSWSWWYPYPWWYHWGFYYGPQHQIIVIGLPSYWFVNWHFYYPHHHHDYPHLSNQYVVYGRRPARVRTTVSTAVEEWETENMDNLPDDFLANDVRRVDRFREFAKLQKEVEEYNRKQYKNPLTTSEFLEKNKEDYPELREVVLSKKKMQPEQESYPPIKYYPWGKSQENQKPDKNRYTEPKKRVYKVNPYQEPANKKPKLKIYPQKRENPPSQFKIDLYKSKSRTNKTKNPAGIKKRK